MYEIAQHTADVRMRVRAASPEELFADALRGLMEIVKPQAIGAAVHASVRVTAPDRTSLLVDLLNEVLTLSHIRREIYPHVSFRSLTATALDAELKGNRVAGFGEDVKAVTYHEAEIVERNGTWETMLVFDV